jgi:hypothetical protein
VLHVHELEADLVGAAGRGHEVVDQLVQLVVGERPGAAREAAVEEGMGVGGERLGLVPGPRARGAPRVRELEAHQQVRLGGHPEDLAVRFDERLAEPREGAERRLSDHELVRIGPPVHAHGHRFAAPDQLGPAPPEVAPAAHGQLRGLPGRGPVPALHGQDAEAVADARAVHLERPRERG